MDAELLAKIAGLLVVYGPGAFAAIQKMWEGVQDIRQNHQRAPTDEELAALVSEAEANHASLPLPDHPA